MPKFVIDETGERVFTCATPQEAEELVAQLHDEKRVAYIATRPAVVVETAVTFHHEFEVGQALRVVDGGGLELIDAADMAAIEATHDELEALESLIDEHMAANSHLTVTDRAKWLRIVLTDYAAARAIAAGPRADNEFEEARSARTASGVVGGTADTLLGTSPTCTAPECVAAGKCAGDQACSVGRPASEDERLAAAQAGTSEPGAAPVEIQPADVGAQQAIQAAAGGLGTGTGEPN